jgi:hypothetical protein
MATDEKMLRVPATLRARASEIIELSDAVCASRSSIANATRVSDRERSIHPKAATLGDVSHAPSGLPRHIGGCHDGVVASATCVKRALAPGYE